MKTGICPACGERFDLSDADEGLVLRVWICPHCQRAFPIQPQER